MRKRCNICSNRNGSGCLLHPSIYCCDDMVGDWLYCDSFELNEKKEITLYRYTYYNKIKPKYYGQTDWLSVTWDECYLDKTTYVLVASESKQVETMVKVNEAN